MSSVFGNAPPSVKSLAVRSEAVPEPATPFATPQVVPVTEPEVLAFPWVDVMSPKKVSLRAGTKVGVLDEFSTKLSSCPLVFVTVASYLSVTQAALGPGSNPLLVDAVLAASEEVTVTLFDATPVKPPKVTLGLRDEWPHAVTVSVTDAFSPWTAVKVHVPVPPGATGAGGQVVLVTVSLVPRLPAGQAGVNPEVVETVPYLLSQI
jgi:hypothetical protein